MAVEQQNIRLQGHACQGSRVPFSHLWEAFSELFEDCQALGEDPNVDSELLSNVGRTAALSLLASPFGSSLPSNVILASAGDSLASQLVIVVGGLCIVVSVGCFKPKKPEGVPLEEDVLQVFSPTVSRPQLRDVASASQADSIRLTQESRSEHEEAEKIVVESKERAREFISSHLQGFLKTRPRASYKDWISEFHPDNVAVHTGEIDQRHLLPNSEHLQIWKEIAEGARPAEASIEEQSTTTAVSSSPPSASASEAQEEQEKRSDPTTGMTHTFKSLSQYYRWAYSSREIKRYWDYECMPVKKRS